MIENSKTVSSSVTRWAPSFQYGIWPAVGIVLAFSIWVMVSVTTFTWLFGDQNSHLIETLWSIPSGLVQFGIIAAIYCYDGVALTEIGLSKRLLRPAAIAAASVLIVINTVILGLGLVAGNDISFGLYAFYRSAPLNLSWSAIAATAFSSYLFVGPAEELAFRGYLQNKLITLFEFGSVRARTASSIVATGAIFSALHVPVQVLVRGTAVSQLAGTVVLLALSGMIFGTIYALTQNLYLVILLHGAGNFWPLVVDPGQGIWPNYFVLLLIYLILIVVYRQVSRHTAVPTPSFQGAE